MQLRHHLWFVLAAQLTAAACDDPPAIILGRLQLTRDAATSDAGAGHDDGREHAGEPSEEEELNGGFERN